MIVPQYWAESRLQHRENGRQVTVRRFGWSNASQEEAQANAELRVREALQRILSGEKLPRRDTKIPYNGADGLPIREEILSQHGENVITRNSYGAHCLNTPNVLFADIDYEDIGSGFKFSHLGILLFTAIIIGWMSGSNVVLVSLLIFAFICNSFLSKRRRRALEDNPHLPETTVLNRIQNFLAKHPEWNFRLYKTPAGMRVLATHQTFHPSDPQVLECFKAFGTDRVYITMCLNQQCFRARLTAKPWRVGIQDHMRPRPGIWPVAPERLPLRNAWIARYEAAAQSFAACSFLENVGSGVTHPEVKPVQELHDELSHAHSGLPIA